MTNWYIEPVFVEVGNPAKKGIVTCVYPLAFTESAIYREAGVPKMQEMPMIYRYIERHNNAPNVRCDVNIGEAECQGTASK